jgi:hypothetical protein
MQANNLVSGRGHITAQLGERASELGSDPS